MSIFEQANGFTQTEQYLANIARQSFLSLWSYPNIFRDEGGVKNGGTGQEVTDLLIVFGKHIIIFSDKDCQFIIYEDTILSWTRWYRKAILASAKQLWGAEKWIREHPDRLFCDPHCQVPFPISLPAKDEIIFHRVLVVHQINEPCKQVMGGSGSLLIDTTISDKDHYNVQNSSVCIQPFKVGKIDSSRGFVHIFDDRSLDIVLKNLDTVTDFIDYLSRKEKLISKPGFVLNAFGEEDLLAHYLNTILGENGKEHHDFLDDEQVNHLSVQKGYWEWFSIHGSYLRQQERDKLSYFWDRMLEHTMKDYRTGELHFSSDSSFTVFESQMRILAKESRFSRRILCDFLIGAAAQFDIKQGDYRIRYSLSDTYPEICYIFFLLNPTVTTNYEDYRNQRKEFLEFVARIAKLRFSQSAKSQDVKLIVGIASEAGNEKPLHSFDFLTYPADTWEENEKAVAEQLDQQLPFFKDVTTYRGWEDEYPMD